MLRDIAPHAHTVVYELPDMHSQFVEMFKRALAHSFPQAKLVDATASGDVELREKLKGTFLLYGCAFRSECDRCIPQRG